MAAQANGFKGYPLPVEGVIKYLQSLNGRDKLNRLLAYAAKAAAYHAEQMKYSKETVDRLNTFSKTVGLGRKMMRIGKPIEYIQQLATAPAIDDVVLKTGKSVQAIFMAAYLWYDMLTWAYAAKAYIDPTPEVTKVKADERWAVGLGVGALLAAYQVQQANEKIRVLNIQIRNTDGDKTALQAQLADQRKQKDAAVMNTVKGVIDFMVPAGRLGWVPLNDGMIGLCGVITSVIAIGEEWAKATAPAKAPASSPSSK